MFTNGTVESGEKSGRAFTVRCREDTMGEGSGAVEVTKSIMVMEIRLLQKR